jgi:hypothetical protein
LAPRSAATTTQYTRPQTARVSAAGGEKKTKTVQAIAVRRRRQPAAVGPKQLGASGMLYILDLRHRINVDSVIAGNANRFDRVFFTIATGTFVATAMWFLQFCALFFIFVRLCSALRHSGAVLPIATGCLVDLA